MIIPGFLVSAQILVWCSKKEFSCLFPSILEVNKHLVILLLKQYIILYNSKTSTMSLNYKERKKKRKEKSYKH